MVVALVVALAVALAVALVVVPVELVEVELLLAGMIVKVLGPELGLELAEEGTVATPIVGFAVVVLSFGLVLKNLSQCLTRKRIPTRTLSKNKTILLVSFFLSLFLFLSLSKPSSLLPFCITCMTKSILIQSMNQTLNKIPIQNQNQNQNCKFVPSVSVVAAGIIAVEVIVAVAVEAIVVAVVERTLCFYCSKGT